MGKPEAQVVMGDLAADRWLMQHTIAEVASASSLHVHFTGYSSPSARGTVTPVTFAKVTLLGNMDHSGGDPCPPAVFLNFFLSFPLTVGAELLLMISNCDFVPTVVSGTVSLTH